ncbi:glycosyltransferase family 2 protein [Devosia sp. Naph2]|uniref:glycosyltransferase family 2 protein n=1 Tax=Devosia polycyclovorans TaxID=3345148 RepID=UPI0035CF5E16
MTSDALVDVRTPTYRRPDMLYRALSSLIEQTHQHWQCRVFDDDPDGAGEKVVAALKDLRIKYHHNRPQNFASKNIDKCFSSVSQDDAEYFCVLEDDNFLLPGFMQANIAACRDRGVEIVLRNQLIEHASGTDRARLSAGGVLDSLFTERTYEPSLFRLSLLAGIGVSNGGLFWSRRAVSKLEIGHRCTATLQEYLRTYSIAEPIHVAMEPLAVWAENAELTTRNNEISAGYLRRELDLKRSVQRLQRSVWMNTEPKIRDDFLYGAAFAAPAQVRARNICKALIFAPIGSALPLTEQLALGLRGLAIAALGRTTDDFRLFMASRQRA